MRFSRGTSTPGCSAARARQTRTLASSEPESTYTPSPEKRAAKTRCMRLVWYTSRERPPLKGKMRTVRSYEPATNSRPVGLKSTSIAAETKSRWMPLAMPSERMSYV